MSGVITIERGQAVATVIIDNEPKRNALSRAMWMQLRDAFVALSQDDSVRCVVLRGRGEKAFGSGGDISEYGNLRSSSRAAKSFAETSYGAMDAVRDCRHPTIAAIQGACVGGAFQLAGLCDLRLSASNSVFGLPLTKLGITVTHFELDGIMRFAGYSGALELLLEGRILSAEEAYAKRLVTRVVEPNSFDDELRAMTTRVSTAAPLAARLHKKFVNQLWRGDALDDASIDEGYACFDTEDYRIGCQSFLDKSSPKFIGR